MSQFQLDVDHPQSEQVGPYLAGKLMGEEREVFERHYFACDQCWLELKVGSAARASVPSRLNARPARRFRLPYALAAAAAVALIALGLWQLSPSDPQSVVVMRSGSSQAFVPVAALEGEGLLLRWPGVSGANRYVVEIFAADGRTILRQETGDTAFAIPPEVRPTLAPAYVRVEAFSLEGGSLLRSSLRRIEAAR